MSTGTDGKTYTVRPVTEDDGPRVMELLKRTFYVHEPLNEAVDLWSEDRPCADLDEYCAHSLLEGMSFKAVDPEGNIVGVTISGVTTVSEENVTSLRNQASECTHAKFQKILYVLAEREESAKLWEKIPNDEKLVEVKVAATDPEWAGLGIMTKLVQETEKAAKERGFRRLRLDTSSSYSAKSADRLEYTCLSRLLYTDIKKDGEPVIVPKPPHVDDRVYIKIL